MRSQPQSRPAFTDVGDEITGVAERGPGPSSSAVAGKGATVVCFALAPTDHTTPPRTGPRPAFQVDCVRARRLRFLCIFVRAASGLQLRGLAAMLRVLCPSAVCHNFWFVSLSALDESQLVLTSSSLAVLIRFVGTGKSRQGVPGDSRVTSIRYIKLTDCTIADSRIQMTQSTGRRYANMNKTRAGKTVQLSENTIYYYFTLSRQLSRLRTLRL